MYNRCNTLEKNRLNVDICMKNLKKRENKYMYNATVSGWWHMFWLDPFTYKVRRAVKSWNAVPVIEVNWFECRCLKHNTSKCTATSH